MGYVYDPELLDVHAETVNQLIDLARNGGTAKLVFDHPRDVRTTRAHINNLLVVLAMYRKDLSDVRVKLRTWTEYEDERWSLYVGTPRHRISGWKKPSMPLVNMSNIVAREHTLRQAEFTSEVTFPKVVRNEAEWMNLAGVITQASEGIAVVKAEFGTPIGPQHLAAFDIFDGWEAKVVGPTTVHWKRKGQ